ncbi:MAG: bifunctional phosphoribosyl-AMP cyclohydrolase/phosphoribosyl-ATP pyrophosphatase, partial [Kineothrix sp.]|nr:bifunctional phosphoribosyl-AMP cyclohydrolase/phosphoribosyl-ATP pyrophosphatase [Kineothrix sp.]
MDNQYKKLVPCIYLYKGNAVKSLSDITIIDTNPVMLAKYYSDNHGDALLVFDMSKGDAEHEEALDIIKEMCKETEIPIIGAGNVHRMEDIKKLLYAGCKKAALNYSKQENIAITEEVSKKFGRDKIAACYTEIDTILENKGLLDEFVDELILVNAAALRESIHIWDGNAPILAMLPEVSLDKLIEILSDSAICGIA